MLELGATGWTLRRPSHGVLPVGTTAESVDAVSTGDAEKYLREVLVVARGARNGKGACLPDWFGAGDFVDGDTSTLYATQVDGLHAYAAAKTKFMVDGVQPIGEKERKIAECHSLRHRVWRRCILHHGPSDCTGGGRPPA
ncbi:expressed unknown protein [Ectocarpus siliculosus]|uniref:Uncharacterized protein n=1 Tax=Ectocarpus siliculosus TaxID=2880 RepID=D7G6F9_ECTSI|nr:expressed unknown protein [Ectocarpus siliculosus]|eukprot:CBJ33945.1 expressed unknown protein [Ectocarpus siliculosus]